MTEQVVDDRRHMIVLPPQLKEVGVLLEPLTIAEKALLEVGDIEDRLPWLKAGVRPPGAAIKQQAVVLGAGPVGLLGALALLLRGFETWVYSREPANDPKALWVQSVGARYLCSDEVPVADLPRAVGNIDLIYEATGAAQIAFKMMEALGVNGVFIFTGVPGRKGPVELDADLIMRNLVLKNQLVYGTVNAGRDAFEAGVSDLGACFARWPAQVAALISNRHPPEACAGLLVDRPAGIKQVIAFPRAP